MSRLLVALLPVVLLAQPPMPPAARGPAATPPEKIKAVKDFKVELLYSVPREQEGSWVSMCTDPAGRLIVSDQYGGLFRVTPPALGGKPQDTKVEKIKVDLGEAQGLLWAFDSLYVVVNRGQKYTSGLYRVRDTDNDGNLDEVKLLRKIEGGGEHGPHAVLLTPDGKSLVVVCGNQTKLMKYDRTRVPPVWGEDHLLPRMPDGNGFMAGVLGPGGAIYQVDPEGKEWELLNVGYRNQYDAAFNRHGDLFTYDADMEWDVSTPWYRPTRVCLAASGAEFGWRNGTGKWPSHYADSLPAVVDIGPGSPTGVVFGYGAKFPAKYQEAFFICDWSYGKLFAVHLSPEGSAYKADFEEFVSGAPLPLTDLVVNPKDGALYFAIGGRRVQSGLYRVTYTGKESTDPAKPDETGAKEREARHKLEAFHGRKDPRAVEAAWPALSSADRYLRYAARVAIEFQDPKEWRAKALAEKDSRAALAALMALVRVSASDPFHRPGAAPPADPRRRPDPRRKPDVPVDQPQEAPPADPKLKADILAALDRLAWEKLTDSEKLELLRVYGLVFNRMGRPDEAARKQVLAKLDARFPSGDRLLDGELCQVLVYLEAPDMAARTLKLIEEAPTQEEQIDYAKSLRVLKNGWTSELRKRYLSWFLKAGTFKGGASFGNFIRNIKKEVVESLPEADRVAFKPIIEATPATNTTPAKPRPFVKKWTLDELVALSEKGLKKRDFNRGRTLFGAANCFACHRFANEGGAQGPDLTGAAGRFSARDLLESVVDPNKVISDQYAAVVIETTDGKLLTGRIVNLNQDNLMVNTDMLNPNGIVTVSRKKVEAMTPAKTSMMPEGLFDTLKEDEVLDLLAFLLSRGDRNGPMFR